eukprot:2292930-Rhodomonas_salina.1
MTAVEVGPLPAFPAVQMRKRGRPRGAKDSVPRRQSNGSHDASHVTSHDDTEASQQSTTPDVQPVDNTEYLLRVMEPPLFEFDQSSPLDATNPFGEATANDDAQWWS